MADVIVLRRRGGRVERTEENFDRFGTIRAIGAVSRAPISMMLALRGTFTVRRYPWLPLRDHRRLIQRIVTRDHREILRGT